jgi:hypothetical protein
MNRIVFCPLLNKEIDGDGVCFDIAMVAERYSTPLPFIPKEAMQKEDWREICLNCPNHIQD